MYIKGTARTKPGVSGEYPDPEQGVQPGDRRTVKGLFTPGLQCAGDTRMKVCVSLDANCGHIKKESNLDIVYGAVKQILNVVLSRKFTFNIRLCGCGIQGDRYKRRFCTGGFKTSHMTVY